MVMSSGKLTLNQERYFFAERFTAPNYSIPTELVFTGLFDKKRLLDSLYAIVDKHDVLRTYISKDEKGDYYQTIFDHVDIDLKEYQIGRFDVATIRKIVHEYVFQPIDFSHKSLTKFQLIRINENLNVFIFTIHHIIFDAVSRNIFIHELSEAWNDLETYLKKPKSSYLETVINHKLDQRENLKAYEEFWTSYLNGSHEVRVTPDFALNKCAESNNEFIVEDLRSNISIKINEVVKKNNVSPFNLFSGAFMVLLSKYLNYTDICITFQSHGRSRLEKPMSIMGLFSNALNLRTKIEKNACFKNLALKIRQDVKECCENERIPFQNVIKLTGVHPKYAINMHPKFIHPHFDELVLESVDFVELQSDFDINFHCNIVENGYNFKIHYNANLFSKSRIALLFEHFQNILDQISKDIDIKISDIKLFSEYDKNLPNIKTPLEETRNGNILDGFLASLKKHPQNNAVHYNGSYLSYENIDNLSSGIAELLKERGALPKQTIAIYGVKSPKIITAMIGILKAGCAFAVFDGSYPDQRIYEYCEILKPDFVVDCTGRFLSFAEILIDSDSYIDISDDVTLKYKINKFVLPVSHTDDTAYYLFTSGTTGTAKCIATGHEPLCHFIKWQKNKFNLEENDRFTMLSGIGHDPVLRDIFAPLNVGACIYIPDHDLHLHPRPFFKWLSAIEPTICHITPPMGKLLCNSAEQKKLDSVKYYFIGGDVLRNDVVKSLRNLSSLTKIVNFYGASETPQAASFFEVEKGFSGFSIPIGKAIDDSQLIILSNRKNDDETPAGVGETGEIAVRSRYLSNGYVGERGDDNRFDSRDGVPIYHTGDYGFYNALGEVVFIGRIDDQIKIRGYRVELQDINDHIKSISGVNDAICSYSPGDYDNGFITGYVLVKDNRLTIKKIDAALRKLVPDYMVPRYWKILSEFPLLPNGKIDRSKLPDVSDENMILHSGEYVPPINEAEENLIEGFEDILGRKNIGIRDSFTSLSGDSLSFVQTTLFLENILGHVPDNWNDMPIEELAKVGRKKGWFYDIKSTVFIRAISIVSIVAFHFSYFFFENGTGVLLMVSGMSFANFQMKAIAHKDNIQPIVSFIVKLAVPTFIYIFLYGIYKGEFHMPSLFFYSNFSEPKQEVDMFFWFIHALIQIMLFFILIFSWRKIRYFATHKLFEFSLILFCFSIILALCVPNIWNTDYLYNRVPHMKLWYFTLGCLVFASRSFWEKIGVFCLAILASYLILEELKPFVLASTLMLLFVTNIKIMYPFHKIIYVLAGASLFIYLTHWQFFGFLNNYLSIVGYPLIEIGAALCGGVIVWKVWEKGSTFLLKRFN